VELRPSVKRARREDPALEVSLSSACSGSRNRGVLGLERECLLEQALGLDQEASPHVHRRTPKGASRTSHCDAWRDLVRLQRTAGRPPHTAAVPHARLHRHLADPAHAGPYQDHREREQRADVAKPLPRPASRSTMPRITATLWVAGRIWPIPGARPACP